MALTVLLAACQTAVENQRGQHSHAGQAEVTAIQGKPSCSIRGGAWQRLAPGTSLREGDAIRTDADSEVDLRFFKTGPVARLKPSSELKFVKMERWRWTTRSPSVTQLELIQGHVLVDDKKLPPESRFEIRTSRGVVYSQGGDVKSPPRGKISVDR